MDLQDAAARVGGALSDAALAALLGGLDDSTRLYRLESAAASVLAGLRVEAFVLEEALSEPWRLRVSTLSSDARLDLDAMLGQPVTLVTVLADGGEHRRSGLVDQVIADDCDGGFARYRLVVRPWLAFLQHAIRSHAWAERDVRSIIDDVLARHALGDWRWLPCVDALLADSAGGGVRAYRVQYRESDLAFLTRVLADEGIGYRFEEGAPGTATQVLVFFADTTAAASCPEDPSSRGPLGGPGIRFHRDGVQEEQDTIQAFGGLRSQPIAVASAVGYDVGAGRVIAADVPTLGSVGGERAPWLEVYDPTFARNFADPAQAERTIRLRQQSIEARHKQWLGRGVVRSFVAGTTFTIAESNLDALDMLRGDSATDDKRFLLTRIVHVGINNLPKSLNQELARRGTASGAGVLPDDVSQLARRRAAERGYANGFEALRANVPWRPEWPDFGPSLDTRGGGLRLSTNPRMPGPLQATVVGPAGNTEPSGAQEVYTDRIGRVRIRYEFQHDEDDGSPPATTWARVMQPFAGNGVGTRWIPRIGHEVLVHFVDDDIEQPIVRCSLYNGRGEGAAAPTPGGVSGGEADDKVYAASTDANAAAQGNLAGGSSPAWHGGSSAELEAGGQRNTAAMSGYKTKEFGGTGHNQLVFDDTALQSRVQLATTQHASQLNLGHLVHQQDNHRGGFRGVGLELRTDAYGAVRGAQGVLLSTYDIARGEPAGDNAAGIALARQWATLAETFHQAAVTHQTVAMAGFLGVNNQSKSTLADDTPPIHAWLQAASGMLRAGNYDAALADAAARAIAATEGQVPHTTDPVVALTARAGIAATAGLDVALAANETVQVAVGQDLEMTAGGALRIHTGQAIGLLGGVAAPGTEAAGTGLTLVSGQGDLTLHAHAGPMQVASSGTLTVQSQSQSTELASPKKVILSVAGGASITIEGGDITLQCPGTLTVKAATKSFTSATNVSVTLPALPSAAMPTAPVDFRLSLQDLAGHHGRPLADRPWQIVSCRTPQDDAMDPLTWERQLCTGTTNAAGDCPLSDDQKQAVWAAVQQRPNNVWLVSGPNATRLTFSRLVADSGVADQHRVLEAHNYAVAQDHLDPAHLNFLRTWAEHDYDAPLAATPRAELDA